MTGKHYILLLVLFLSLFQGCQKDQDNNCLEVEFNTNLFENGARDVNTLIVNHELEGNCLELTLSYPGGCEDHHLELAAIGWIKTDPPKIEARIIHDNTDLCEALITDYLTFDLEPLRYNDNDELIIILEGLDLEILHKYID